MRPAIGSKSYEIYQTPPSNVNTSLISNGTLRIPLSSSTLFVVGDAIIARYSFTTHVLYAQDVADLTIQSITIYTSWYMGIFTIRIQHLNMIDYHVKLHNERWMSTAADCMHFADSRGLINVFDSSCEGQGDDGLNVQAFYFQVVRILSSNTLIIQENNWPDTLNVGIGTNLEFSRSLTPFTPYATATVASSSVNNSNSRVFTFTSSINASVGDMVCVADTPSLTIRNLTVANNRARGVLLETRNIEIIQSLFNATSGPAVLFQPSLYWNEGPGARNVLLSQNVYINCNEGIVREEGVIALLPYPVQLAPVIYNVQVTSSTFFNGQYSGSMIQCTNGEGLSISGNYLSTNSITSPITLCNSQNISAYNNSIVNNQTIISNYFSYDTISPCVTSLTSLINLPPSAFNSSFPPPVNATIVSVQPNVSQMMTSTSTIESSTSVASIDLFILDKPRSFILLPFWALLHRLRLTVY
jgi:hypothetical protein